MAQSVFLIRPPHDRSKSLNLPGQDLNIKKVKVKNVFLFVHDLNQSFHGVKGYFELGLYILQQAKYKRPQMSENDRMLDLRCLALPKGHSHTFFSF